MLQINYKDLSQEIGEDVLAKSAHILEQTILMENWLGSENLVEGNFLQMWRFVLEEQGNKMNKNINMKSIYYTGEIELIIRSALEPPVLEDTYEATSHKVRKLY